MKRILFQTLWMAMLMLIPATAMAKKKQPKPMTDREYWCSQAYKMAQPVLENMAKGELQKNMQLEVSPNWDGRSKKVAYMETFGRLMAGIAPWLSLPDDETAEGEIIRVSYCCRSLEYFIKSFIAKLCKNTS